MSATASQSSSEQGSEVRKVFDPDRLHDLLHKLLLAFAIVGAIALAVILYRWFDDDERITYVAASADATGELTGVFVLPDDGEDPFLDEINAAQTSIRLYLYLLSDDESIEALERAVDRGVDVRVMLEEHPYGGAGTEEEVFQRLEASGVDVRWGDSDYRFTHIKTIVLDDRVALIMNLNMTETAFEGNREFAVVTTDSLNVNQAIAIFESDWNRLPDPSPGPLVVSPATSRSDLTDLIRSATTRIDVYAEVITDPWIMEALIAAELRGVEVRLVMSESSTESLWDEEPGTLAQHGVEVRIQNRIYIHAKALIIDDAIVWVGSQNFTSTSLDDNRELGIIVSDTESVVRVVRAFEADFSTGDELRSAA